MLFRSIAASQAGVAGVSAYGIGQVAKHYLANGATWGPNSPRTVIQEILASVDQAYILSRVKAELGAKLRPTAP